MQLRVVGQRSMIASVRPDKIKFPPPGVLGGRPGQAGRFTINGKDVAVRPYALKPGDRVTLKLPGGGGYGKPRTRPKDLVLRDLAEGYISPTSAYKEYGVKVTAKRGRAKASRTRRAESRTRRSR